MMDVLKFIHQENYGFPVVFNSTTVFVRCKLHLSSANTGRNLAVLEFDDIDGFVVGEKVFHFGFIFRWNRSTLWDKMSVFRVSYDDSVVKFADRYLRDFRTTSVNVQKCTIDQAEVSKGINLVKIKDNFCLTTDARNLGGQEQGRSYRWYVKTSALAKEKLSMNTVWQPAYCVIQKGRFAFSNMTNDERINTADENESGIAGETNLLIVPNLEVCTAFKRSEWYRGDILVMPLLETIVNVCPIHSGKSLKALCADISQAYEDWMDNPFHVMANLFNHFKPKFNELSQKEACSFGELHDCLFENTFKLSLHQKPSSSLGYDGTTSLFLKNRRMFVKSSLISADNYGDIPWHLADDKETEVLRVSKPMTVFNDVFAIVSKEVKVIPKGDSVEYLALFIFPAMEIDGKSYPYGSMVGLMPNGQMDFRGPLFEDISPREQFCIDYLFNEHAKVLEVGHSNLKKDTNPAEYCRKMYFPSGCRSSLIEKVKDCFLLNKRPL